jgi:hypothetical protein
MNRMRKDESDSILYTKVIDAYFIYTETRSFNVK